jgi:hypothetical protein
MGGISKCGDAMMHTVLFEAVQSMLTRTIKWSWLKAWGMKIAKRRGMKRAIVAVGRSADWLKFKNPEAGPLKGTSKPRDLERLAAIVALEQRHRRRGRPALFQHPPETERRVQAKRNLGLHVGELLLHELICGKRTAELLARFTRRL